MTRVGATFSGYQLVRLLGRGGAGTVYLAESPTGGAAGRVALKIFDIDLDDATILEVMRQAQSIALLDHPHVLACYGDVQEGGMRAIVMEYAEDGSLGDTIAAGPAGAVLPLKPALVVPIIGQVASVLADIHVRGMAHGDLKPTNLFVRTGRDGNPDVALGDFGHAFLARTAVIVLSQGGYELPDWVMDELTWVAPEQLGDDPIAASDQYSLAAIAYYLLTGTRPVSAHTQSLLHERAPRPITPPSRLNPELDEAVDTVLLHALSPVPQRRFDDILSFARALDAALIPPDAAQSGREGMGARSGIRPSGSFSGSRSSITNRRQTHEFPGLLTLPTTMLPRVESRAASDDAAIDAEWEAAEADEALSDQLAMADAATVASKRRHAIVRLGMVALLVVCIIAVLIASGKLPMPGFVHLGGTANATATVPGETAAQQAAESRLQSALTHQPTYSDALMGAPADWTVDGKSVFFGSDHRLHLHNTAKTPLFADMPAKALMPSGAYAAQVNVAFVSGAVGSHAGMRFLVSKSTSGETYYSFLITPSGRFELWAQQPSTGLVFVTSGSVGVLKQGNGVANTLAVLIDPTAKTLTLFANGTFLYNSPIDSGVPLTGRLGLLTPDANVEAAFANFAVYPA